MTSEVPDIDPLTKRDMWIVNGPRDLPPCLESFWDRLMQRLPKEKLRESDGEMLILIAGALYDSEYKLGYEVNASIINARRMARLEYKQLIEDFREVIRLREDFSVEFAKGVNKINKDKPLMEDFIN